MGFESVDESGHTPVKMATDYPFPIRLFCKKGIVACDLAKIFACENFLSFNIPESLNI